MTADKPEDAPTTEETTPLHDAPAGSEGSELEPTEGRKVGQGVEPAGPGGPMTPESKPRKESPAVRRQTRISAAFIALVVGLIILVLLLIFILQNNTETTVKYFGAQGQLPLGVLLLFAAAAGALLVVIFGAARILQLHWLARRDRRSSTRKTPGGPR